jgi:hypothetical protein
MMSHTRPLLSLLFARPSWNGKVWGPAFLEGKCASMWLVSCSTPDMLLIVIDIMAWSIHQCWLQGPQFVWCGGSRALGVPHSRTHVCQTHPYSPATPQHQNPMCHQPWAHGLCHTRRVADVQKHWPMTVSVHDVMATGSRGFDTGERVVLTCSVHLQMLPHARSSRLTAPRQHGCI